MERRTLIRLLVGLGIGIPVAVEAVTLLGLVETRLFGDGGAATPTPGPRRVGIGDELLADTPQTETLTDAVVRGQGRPWVCVLTIAVDNPTEAAYELRLGTLTLGSGRTVAGGASTGRIAPGGSGRVTGAWEIPQGSTPDALEVVAVDYAGATPAATTARVPLAKVPVQGS
ncbi:MAG: hypothetical protein ABEJ92_07395 [Halobacteriales archaeon]